MRSASRKPLRDHQQRPLALALEQRVGGDRGAHADIADAPAGIGAPGGEARAGRGCPAPRRRDRPPGSRRAACARAALPCGIAADHVGEGAAAIDPEVPAAAVMLCFLRVRFHDDETSINRKRFVDKASFANYDLGLAPRTAERGLWIDQGCSPCKVTARSAAVRADRATLMRKASRSALPFRRLSRRRLPGRSSSC